MGQNVEIKDSVTLGEVLVIDTDRSFTGQDGHRITRDSPGYGVPGKLAERLFELELGVDHVYVLQNTVTVRRTTPWDDDSAAAVAEVTGTFLRHYPDGDVAATEEE